METKILTGEPVQEKILAEVKTEIMKLTNNSKRAPGIAFIGFSSVPLAKYTIPLHVRMAEELGFIVYTEVRSEHVTEGELYEIIENWNNNDDINAIVILQPLPEHLNPIRISNMIRRDKEVEGFHPGNLLGTLMPDVQQNKYPMCLPAALYELFDHYKIQIEKDREWVFVMDDEFFSNPLTSMIVRAAASRVVPKDCPLTILNRNSGNLAEHCRKADFLVVVTKEPEFVQTGWLKQGVCIIDIYSNLVKEVQSKKDPSRMIPVIRGGVNVESVKNIAAAIVPVPGGLMTVVLAILFRNAITSYKHTLLKTTFEGCSS